ERRTHVRRHEHIRRGEDLIDRPPPMPHQEGHLLGLPVPGIEFEPFAARDIIPFALVDQTSVPLEHMVTGPHARSEHGVAEARLLPQFPPYRVFVRLARLNSAS